MCPPVRRECASVSERGKPCWPFSRTRHSVPHNTCTISRRQPRKPPPARTACPAPSPGGRSRRQDIPWAAACIRTRTASQPARNCLSHHAARRLADGERGTRPRAAPRDFLRPGSQHRALQGVKPIRRALRQPHWPNELEQHPANGRREKKNLLSFFLKCRGALNETSRDENRARALHWCGLLAPNRSPCGSAAGGTDAKAVGCAPRARGGAQRRELARRARVPACPHGIIGLLLLSNKARPPTPQLRVGPTGARRGYHKLGSPSWPC